MNRYFLFSFTVVVKEQKVKNALIFIEVFGRFPSVGSIIKDLKKSDKNIISITLNSIYEFSSEIDYIDAQK